MVPSVWPSGQTMLYLIHNKKHTHEKFSNAKEKRS
jgi:hypothetical protein